MYEPLRALFDGDATALPVCNVLGEKACRLHGADARDAYVCSGGVAFAACTCVTHSDMTVSTATQRQARDDADAHASHTRSRHGGSSSSSNGGGGGALRVLLSLTQRSALALLRAVARPRRTLHDVLLCSVASVLPVLRVLVPTAVPRYRQLPLHQQLRCHCHGCCCCCCASLSHSSSSSLRPRRACVCDVAWHPTLPLLAVAVDEGVAGGLARVHVYRVCSSSSEQRGGEGDGDVAMSWRAPVCVLTHAFQRHVCALAWQRCAQAVLAVGCEAGVLLWYVVAAEAVTATATATSSDDDDVAASLEHNNNSCRRRGGRSVQHVGKAAAVTQGRRGSGGSAAWALFYRCARGARVTTLAFAHRDGHYVACGSVDTTQIYVLDVRRAPHERAHIACRVAPSLDGGSELVCFSDDDALLLSAVCAHSTLTLTRLRARELGTEVVGVPAPVLQLVRARGAGEDCYVVRMRGYAGVVLARIRPRVGVAVVCVVATSMYRGVGGDVCAVACSERRLWLSLSSGHVLWCYYNKNNEENSRVQCMSRAVASSSSSSGSGVVVLPIGVAAVTATQLHGSACARACGVHGSLVALVEHDTTLHLLPSYHP